LAAVLAQGWGWDKEFFHTGAQQKEETMAHLFDPGYGNEPFRTLCQGYCQVNGSRADSTPIYCHHDFEAISKLAKLAVFAVK